MVPVPNIAVAVCNNLDDSFIRLREKDSNMRVTAISINEMVMICVATYTELDMDAIPLTKAKAIVSISKAVDAGTSCGLARKRQISINSFSSRFKT
jgi:hypothetical protein